MYMIELFETFRGNKVTHRICVSFMGGGFHVSSAASDCKIPCPLALPTGFSFCWVFASVMTFLTKVAVVIVLSSSLYCMGILCFFLRNLWCTLCVLYCLHLLQCCLFGPVTCRASAMLRLFHSLSKDFCVDLRFSLKMKKLTRRVFSTGGSCSHCFIICLNLLRNAWAGLSGCCLHCRSWYLETQKFDLGSIYARNFLM